MCPLDPEPHTTKLLKSPLIAYPSGITYSAATIAEYPDDRNERAESYEDGAEIAASKVSTREENRDAAVTSEVAVGAFIGILSEEGGGRHTEQFLLSSLLSTLRWIGD